MNRAPVETIATAEGFRPSDAFLEKLLFASARFNNGGSASFVSPAGLLFTNHHVGADCIHKLGSAQADYITSGFLARTRAEEKACPDLEVNVLRKIDDVTARVTEGVSSATPAEANRLRKANMSRIEKECTEATGLRCDVVTLYSGAEFHLYQYKKYTDIRLVFAPEQSIAAFGGDPDNFTYPRYCLDIAFFRAYENGQPATVQHYLPWSAAGAQDGELAFVSGHPGTTGRLDTYSQLEFFRDVQLPSLHKWYLGLIRDLETYRAKGPEERRVSGDLYDSLRNSYKAYSGFLSGLRDPALMGRKREQERQLRAVVEENRELTEKYGKAWEDVAEAMKGLATFYRHYAFLEQRLPAVSELFWIARTTLRVSEERAKPDAERLREFAEAGLPSLERRLYSPAPLTDSQEIVVLTYFLRQLERELGAGDSAVKAILGKRSAAEAARFYVSTSRLKEVAERKRLAASADESRQSTDGMLVLARLMDGPARAARKRYEDEVEAVLQSSAARIAQARFAVLGPNAYPDATFTLRLSYGRVKGYPSGGKEVPWSTRFHGLYARATGRDPFRLPASWVKSKARLKLDTPFNFVTTCDIHGGNSGSPTVNTKGEVIGIVFDSNLEGLPNRYVYADEQARAVHVASQGVVEALRVVYNAGALLQELGAGR